MSVVKSAKVWLGGRKGITAPIRVSQYDTGWQFQLTVYDGDSIYVGSGDEIAVLNGKKANGAAFSVAGTFASGVATFDCPVTITEAVGVTECELRLTSAGETVGTANFDMIVERAPLSGYYASGDDFSAVAQLIDNMVGRVPDAAADWLEDHITNPSNPPIDTSLSVSGAAADAAVVGENILLKYTGSAPTESLTELPDNCWWPVSGDVLRTLLGDTFLWLDDIQDSASWYYRVNVIRVSATMRRFEIGGAGSFIRWAGYILTDQSDITWYSDYPDTSLTESHVPADAKTVGENILLQYTGTAPTESITELPDNCWWLTNGEVLRQLLSVDDSFVWLEDIATTSYIVNVFRVSSTMRRFEIRGAGGPIRWTGYILTNQTEITWVSELPDTTLTESRVPADAKTVGDNITRKYTGTAPTVSITELPDNSWWVATGAVLQPLLGPAFVWTLTSTNTYIVKKILAHVLTRRYEIVSVGGTILWAGWATTGNITWSYNMLDIIDNSEAIMLTKHNSVQNGITWEWQTDGSCKVWGTSTNISINNIIPATELPSFLSPTAKINTGVLGLLIPGDKVEFRYKTTNNNIMINMFWSDGTTPRYVAVTDGYGVLTIPQNTTRWGVRLYIPSGVTISQSDPAIVSDIHITKFCPDVVTGGGALSAKFLGFGNSVMTGSVWALPSGQTTPIYSHLCPYDDAPYAGIANGLGVRQDNVDYTLISDTTFMIDANGTADGYYCFKNCILRTNLLPYDYVLLTLGSYRELGLCPLGDLNSVAGDGSVVGGVLEVLNYMRTNANGNPLCTAVICSPSPYMVPAAGYNAFTSPIQGPDGPVTVAELDTIMHQLAEREHCIYVDFQDMWLSYHWHDFTPTPSNVHLASDRGYRIVSEYLRRKVVG